MTASLGKRVANCKAYFVASRQVDSSRSEIIRLSTLSRPRSRSSVGSIGNGSDSESVSSSAEMDVSVGSGEGPDVSSAACASSEGDTSSSIETCAVNPYDPCRGPKGADITVGPFRPYSKDMPGLKYPSRLQGQRYRCFHDSWYAEFDWLEYSIDRDAAFCFCCRLRSTHMSGSRSDPSFIIQGSGNWKDCPNSFRRHASSEFHKTSYVHWIEGRHMKASGDSIAQQLSRQYCKDVEENRRNVKKLLEVVRLFCKQNIPFRGHDESENSTNRGNYLEILHWIAKDSPELKKHLERSFHYTSPESQNDIYLDLMYKSIL